MIRGIKGLDAKQECSTNIYPYDRCDVVSLHSLLFLLQRQPAGIRGIQNAKTRIIESSHATSACERRRRDQCDPRTTRIRGNGRGREQR
jgi:hypothetical protein